MKNQKLKRILAWAGIILLLGLYLVTFILGVTGNEATKNLFLACIVCTVVVPCLMYGMLLLAKVLSHRNDPDLPQKKKK